MTVSMATTLVDGDGAGWNPRKWKLEAAKNDDGDDHDGVDDNDDADKNEIAN